jgi:hypothetical protein
MNHISVRLKYATSFMVLTTGWTTEGSEFESS